MKSPVSFIIQSLLKAESSAFIFSREMPYPLQGRIIEFRSESNRLCIEIQYFGSDIESYIQDGGISLDLESVHEHDVSQREVYSLAHVPVVIYKIDSHTFHFECQLPDTLLIKESKGTRIPFILGMNCPSRLEVYPHTLHISGILRDLSAGGCMVEIELAESLAVTTGQDIPGMTIEFPNGDTFHAEARICSIRPFGNKYHAVVGLQFINLNSLLQDRLHLLIAESEKEIAFRTGLKGSSVIPSYLFVHDKKSIKILRRDHAEKEKNHRLSHEEDRIQQIAHHLQLTALYLKMNHILSLDMLYDCVDTLSALQKSDRNKFLYALSSVREEPDWIRHAVQIAGRLADLMHRRDPHNPVAREVILGALLHTMGKPLLIGKNLPTLKMNMGPEQKEILKKHPETLLKALESTGWNPSPFCLDIIQNASETLNGSGYPKGMSSGEFSDALKLFSVIKVINKLTNPRNDIPPRSPLKAYKKISNMPGLYDRKILIEYIQAYGLYPVGSLARYSGGFVGWVMETDGRGEPVTILVVKNLRFPHNNISTMVSGADLCQLGKLESIVVPSDYNVSVIRL